MSGNGKDPFLTAVIPVYNGERYLRETLDGVLAIPYQNMEVLLIDDGSEDASAAICSAYAARDRRLRYLRQEHRGIAASRNSGVGLARGEYICFWDQDDTVIPEGYLELLRRTHHAGAQIGMCSTGRMIRGRVEVYESLSDGIWSGEQVKRGLLYPLLFRGYRYPFCEDGNYLYGSVWKCIFRTDFIRQSGIEFRRFVSYEDDWIFVTHALCCADRAVSVAARGYVWRVNGVSESHAGRYIDGLGKRFDAQDRYVFSYLRQGVQNRGILAEYHKVSLCGHYVDWCGNSANAPRTAYGNCFREYLRRTDYRKQLTCRKRLRRSAYRRRLLLRCLAYGSADMACGLSRCYDRLETLLSASPALVRLERRRKIRDGREATG